MFFYNDNMKCKKIAYLVLPLIASMTFSACSNQSPSEDDAFYSISYFESEQYTLSGPTQAKAGQEVNFSISDIASGYCLDYFLVNNVKQESNTFVMPKYDTLVEAILTTSDENTYDITFGTYREGTIASNMETAKAGTEVPIFVKANSGYRLNKIKANDVYLTTKENQSGQYYAHTIMQNKPLHITAEFVRLETQMSEYAFSMRGGDEANSAQSFWKFEYGQEGLNLEVSVIDQTIVAPGFIASQIWQKDGVELQICLESTSNITEEAKALRFLFTCDGLYYAQRVKSDKTYYRTGEGMNIRYNQNFYVNSVYCKEAVNGFNGYVIKAFIGYELFNTDYQGAYGKLTFAPAMRDSTSYDYSTKKLSTSWKSTTMTMTATNMNPYMDTLYHCNWFNPRSYLRIARNGTVEDRYLDVDTDVLFIGDSYTIVSCYGSLYDDWSDVETSTVGFGSSTSYDWATGRCLSLATKINPRNIVVHIGGNDFYLKNYTVSDALMNTKTMINSLLSDLPNVNIYFVLLLYRAYHYNEEKIGMVNSFNTGIKEAYQSNSRVKFCDVTSKFVRSDGTANESMFFDSTHPNSYGCAVISNELRTLMGLPKLSDSERFGSHGNAVATNGFTYEEVNSDTYLRQRNSISKFSDRYVYFKQDLTGNFTSSAYFNAEGFYNDDSHPKFGYILNDGEQQLYYFIDTNDYYERKAVGLATRTNGRDGTYNYNALPSKTLNIFFSDDDYTKLTVTKEGNKYCFYVNDYKYGEYADSFFEHDVSIGFFSFNTKLNIKNPTLGGLD